MKRNHRDHPNVRGVWPPIVDVPRQPRDSRVPLIVALCLIVLSMALLLALL